MVRRTLKIVRVINRLGGWAMGWAIEAPPLLSRSRISGAPRRIRTYDPRIRSPMLYPAELGVRSGAQLSAAARSSSAQA
jgi:hypothetical protein